ncbi:MULTISPECIES: hypothetical protein [Stenotrophomonas]|uniref:hypothetical protein n=1 Tax=Stenotrophomonas TaxID=40323 RepID=UPI001FB01880|nr:MULTISPECIES: hypothetical protein [Stenotrophomonas]MDN8662320.1 hypothetical protein [Stenotrophomonas indicatrix]
MTKALAPLFSITLSAIVRVLDWISTIRFPEFPRISAPCMLSVDKFVASTRMAALPGVIVSVAPLSRQSSGVSPGLAVPLWPGLRFTMAWAGAAEKRQTAKAVERA